MENKSLPEFLNRCKSGNIPQSEMYQFLRVYTNNFDKKAFDYLRSDLNKYADNIKFTLILENENDGTVDKSTTVKNYIENQLAFLSLVLTPRQKIDFVVNDIEEKKMNYYADEAIFTLETNGFLRFSDLVDAEYKRYFQKNITDLISESLNFDEITKPINKFHLEVIKAQYDFEFVDWLKKNKDLKYGDSEYYNSLVTKDNWLLFLKYKKRLEYNATIKYNAEKRRRKSIIENIQPQPESDFDTSDKTNPLIIETSLIHAIHREFDGYLWPTIDIDNFKNCFRKVPKKLVFHDSITMPEICYFFEKIERKQVVVSPFKKWMVYHIGGNNYGKNKAEFNRIVSEAKNKRKGFSLTVPQQKAIENKEKIDSLFNRILSN